MLQSESATHNSNTADEDDEENWVDIELARDVPEVVPTRDLPGAESGFSYFPPIHRSDRPRYISHRALSRRLLRRGILAAEVYITEAELTLVQDPILGKYRVKVTSCLRWTACYEECESV